MIHLLCEEDAARVQASYDIPSLSTAIDSTRELIKATEAQVFQCILQNLEEMPLQNNVSNHVVSESVCSSTKMTNHEYRNTSVKFRNAELDIHFCPSSLSFDVTSTSLVTWDHYDVEQYAEMEEYPNSNSNSIKENVQRCTKKRHAARIQDAKNTNYHLEKDKLKDQNEMNNVC